MGFKPQDHPICFTRPARIAPHYWAGHVPFAMFLIELVRPKIFVELGTYYGVSYCAFCQAVKALRLNTHCYGIDTWQGDGITWSYEINEVLEDLTRHHDPLYGNFSRLTRSTFDNALQGFADGEIDLLHLDGYHPYESVKHDYETWLPKMSARGIMVFHDINVRQEDYGVWKLWEEISKNRPHFEFWHEHGLGVLAVGSEIPEAVSENLFNLDEQTRREVRDFFFQMGETWKPLFSAVEMSKKNRELTAENEQLQQRLAESTSQLARIQGGMAYRLVMKIRGVVERLAPQNSLGRRLIQRMLPK